MDISIEVPKEVIIKAKLDRLVDGLDRFLFIARKSLRGSFLFAFFSAPIVRQLDVS